MSRRCDSCSTSVIVVKARWQSQCHSVAAELMESYGLGFAVTPTTFSHGGAFSTNSFADTARGQIFVWLVQHAGFPGEGVKSQEAFLHAAREAFRVEGK